MFWQATRHLPAWRPAVAGPASLATNPPAASRPTGPPLAARQAGRRALNSWADALGNLPKEFGNQL